MSKHLNTMVCEELTRKLPPHLDGETAGQDQAAIERHLGSCPVCRREMEQLRADMKLLAEAGVPEPRPYMVTRVMAEIRSRRSVRARFSTGLARLLGSTVAVLVVSVCISIGAMLGSGLGRGSAGTAAGSDELAVSADEPTFADIFTSVVGGE